MFRRRRWFQGRPIHGTEVSDIGWFTPDGSEMSEDDWQRRASPSRSACSSTAARSRRPNERGEPVVDDSFYVMFNAHQEPLEFTLPETKWGDEWTVVLDTAEDTDHMSEEEPGPEVQAGAHMPIQPWSLVLLQRTDPR